MGLETNIDSIRALETQIKEGEGDVIMLKRARNSLLNISTRVPPEIIGYIFDWSLVRDPSFHFDGLRKGSYNFLLVCHHWFEIASRTPELWSFWGSTLQDWKKRHHRSGATPLDLVLDGGESDPDVPFDESLQNAVKSRVMQDTIRQVHLRSCYPDTLTSIISSLTPDGEGGQNENIESIVWENEVDPTVDISNFFARSRLSRLRCLRLYSELWFSSWDRLVPQTTHLTALSLGLSMPQSLPTPTAAQLFAILTANPNLRNLTLADAALPNDADVSTFKVQLRNLNTLNLTGECRHIFGVLRQLIVQEALDDMWLSGSNPTAGDISQTLAPYMRDYFRRDARFQGRLGVNFSSSHDTISIVVGVVGTQTVAPGLKAPRVSFRIDDFIPEALGQLVINLSALIPQEHVVSFRAGFSVWPPEELFFMMPKIEMLHLSDLRLSEGFLQPKRPHANTKLFPSLRLLHLEDVVFLNEGDWSHFMTYLVHQTLDGQNISLVVVGDFPHDCPEIVNGINGLVKEFTHFSHSRNSVAEEDE